MFNSIKSIQDPTSWLADEEAEKEELAEIRRAEYQAKKELEVWVANKNHASYGLIYKNTHLEFAHSYPQDGNFYQLI